MLGHQSQSARFQQVQSVFQGWNGSSSGALERLPAHESFSRSPATDGKVVPCTGGWCVQRTDSEIHANERGEGGSGTSGRRGEWRTGAQIQWLSKSNADKISWIDGCCTSPNEKRQRSCYEKYWSTLMGR